MYGRKDSNSSLANFRMYLEAVGFSEINSHWKRINTERAPRFFTLPPDGSQDSVQALNALIVHGEAGGDRVRELEEQIPDVLLTPVRLSIST